MKIWLTVGCAALFIVASVSPVFAASAVEYVVIGSKGATGNGGSGKALNRKFSKVSEKMSQHKPSSRALRPNTSPSGAGKMRDEESKTITLVPAIGGALDPETGL